jgi:hypothetical protein
MHNSVETDSLPRKKLSVLGERVSGQEIFTGGVGYCCLQELTRFER